MRFPLFLLFVLLIGQSCEDPIYTPKPRAYPKIEFPERNFQAFNAEFCDFNFEIPSYVKVERDTTFFNEKPLHPCWFDLYVPEFDSRIHCSYIPISSENLFSELNADAFQLAGKHNAKADYIDELPIRKPNGTAGFVFDIEGEVASPFQFFLTDSTNHFFRGALYFNTQARPDSLAPLYDFMKEDIMHLINTFEWE